MIWIALGICILGLVVCVKLLFSWDKNCELAESLRKKSEVS